MLRALVSRAREWIAVDDPEDRIEGSGEPIMSPKIADRRRPSAYSASLETSKNATNDGTNHDESTPEGPVPTLT
ncbi:hypothetical protein D8S78_12810 [Natrialba swarupiae]|nr:hypothetical protein [Natrialba swarupiae]